MSSVWKQQFQRAGRLRSGVPEDCAALSHVFLTSTRPCGFPRCGCLDGWTVWSLVCRRRGCAVLDAPQVDGYFCDHAIAVFGRQRRSCGVKGSNFFFVFLVSSAGFRVVGTAKALRFVFISAPAHGRRDAFSHAIPPDGILRACGFEPRFGASTAWAGDLAIEDAPFWELR